MAELKRGWKRVKFGDVVRLNGERCANPLEEGIERYVGLEHLEPGDLRVRSWGNVADGTTFTNRFKPGQVLFGKRRAYQKKVALADFEGICSGDIYVFESADPKRLLPELLPFICQTDAFFEYAVGTSAGSLSPRTNWKSLAEYEFALPPVEEQRRLASLMARHEELLQALKDAVSTSQVMLKSLLGSVIEDDAAGERGQIPLEAILECIIDYRGRTPEKSSSGVPLITAKNVREGYVDTTPEEFIATKSFDPWMTRGIPREGDVLFTTEAPLGFVAPAPSYRFAMAQRLLALRANPKRVTPRFLYWLMQSPPVQNQVHKRATGTTVTGIKQSVLRVVAVHIPTINRQDDVVRLLDAQHAAMLAIERRMTMAEQARTLALQTLLDHRHVHPTPHQIPPP